MATDSLQIFNKALADKLIEKDADEFEILDVTESQRFSAHRRAKP